MRRLLNWLRVALDFRNPPWVNDQPDRAWRATLIQNGGVEIREPDDA